MSVSQLAGVQLHYVERVTTIALEKTTFGQERYDLSTEWGMARTQDSESPEDVVSSPRMQCLAQPLVHID